MGQIRTFGTGKNVSDRWLSVKEYGEKYRLSPKQVIRRIKKRLIEAEQPQPGCVYRIYDKKPYEESIGATTAERIVIEEERKQAVLAHFEDLRATASRWNSELRLPPPWRWDIADLKYVFYVDRREVNRGKGTTGYRLPSDLLDSEESESHFRHFAEGCFCWGIQEDGAIVLKLPVEDEAGFRHLKAHTQESLAWGLFAKWKKEGGTYIQFCSSLLGRIEQDARRATKAESKLFSWVIYHDAFCIRDTAYRCETCGAENLSGSRHCQNCNLPLGWLRPIAEEYERATNHPKSSPIHIHGWGNIEESVEIGRFEGMKRGHRDLKVKYRGHDLVETILQREKEVKETGAELNQAVQSLSQQGVFSGSCEVCPL